MKKNDSPCYGCKEREVGCHANCERFAAWKKAHMDEQCRIRTQIENDNIYYNYCAASIRKYKKQREHGRKRKSQ